MRIWEDFYDPPQPKSFRYPKIPLKELFRRNVMDYPDKPYLIINDTSLDYKTCNYLACSLANYLLKTGVTKGDRLAIMTPNIPQYLITLQACFKTGIIVVPTNPLYTVPELTQQFKDSGTKVVVVAAMFADKVIEIMEKNLADIEKIITIQIPGREVDINYNDNIIDFNQAVTSINNASEPDIAVYPEDIALLQYTGGTTGIAKGCCLTNANILAMALQTTTAITARCPLNDIKTLAAIPLYHIYGHNTNTNVCLISGGTMVLVPLPTSENILANVQKHSPTVWASVPAMIIGLNNHPDTPKSGVGSIKVIIGGSSPLAVEAMRKFEELSGGVIIEGYGLSETSNVLTVNTISKRKPGTVGIPLPDVDIRIVDLETGTQDMPLGEAGEIIAKGPQVMKEYWNNPAETEQVFKDGWLYTGDIGIMDEEGFITIVDRKKDMILSSGFNVYPRDIDEVLYKHPKILEACAIGIPDEKRGESIKAYIVPKPNETITEEDIINFCRENLAPYKVPKGVEIIDSLPRTSVGKPDRKALRALSAG